jgi:hypothetical protein
MLLGMWCNSCVLADIRNKSWNEMRDTIWGAQSRVPRGSAQSRIGAWGPTPMQPLFDVTTQLATYVEKGWSCALLRSNRLCNHVQSLCYQNKGTKVIPSIKFVISIQKLYVRCALGFMELLSSPLPKLAKLFIYQVHVFLWIVSEGLWKNGIESRGIINNINMMCKIKSAIINPPSPSYIMNYK